MTRRKRRGSLSKKRRMEELIKCGADVVYFLRNFAKIVTLEGGTVDFNLFEFQEELLDMFQKKDRIVILKARQMGISTVTAGYVTWKIIFESNQNVVIVATDRETAKELMDKVKKILNELPEWMRDTLNLTKLITNNDREIKLKNESKVIAAAKGEDAVRSKAINLLVIDEAAFISNSDKVWTAAQPTLSTGGDCIVLSTPNGVGGWFYDTYEGALLDSEHPEGNDFIPYELLWDKHPKRDEEWFRKTMKSLNNDKKKFAQEYGCSFEASGDTVASGEAIKKYKEEFITPPKYKRGYENNFWVWKDYDIRREYIMVADIARGDGDDFSTFWLIDLKNYEQVGGFKGQLETSLFSDTLMSVGYEYGECPIVVENNGVGHAVVQDLRRENYPNIWYSEKGTNRKVEPWKAEVRKGNRKEIVSGVVAGVSANAKTKPLWVDKFQQYVNNFKINIKDRRAIEEMQTYIWLNRKATAQKGKNDDFMSALGILAWILDENYKVMQNSTDAYINMIKGIKRSETKFSIGTPGMKKYNKDLDINGNKKKMPFLGVYRG